MIDAKELRIGNIIDNKGEAGWGQRDGYAIVLSIEEDSVNEWNDMGASGCLYSQDIQPMVITPNWLTRLGFENLRLHNFEIEYDGHAGYGITYNGNFLRGVEFIHEIQNIIYSITSIELTIKK